MAVIFSETFDYGSGANSGDYHWDSYGASTYATGRYGSGYAAMINAGYSNTKTLPSSYQTIILAFNYKTNGPTAGVTVAKLMDVGTTQLYIAVDDSLHLLLYRGTTLVATSTNMLNVNTDYWLSWKSYIHDSSGTSEIKVNGTSTGWINFSGDTKATTNTTVNGFALFGTSGVYWDDLIVMDTSGSTMNDHILERKGYIKQINGAGDLTAWTPSTGSNYQCVDELAVNDDTDYVSTSVATTRDSYVHVAATEFTSIDFVQLRAVVRKDDVDAHTASIGYRRSSTNYDGTATTVNASYGEICRIDHVDPATSAAWTQTNFNNTQAGILLDS